MTLKIAVLMNTYDTLEGLREISAASSAVCRRTLVEDALTSHSVKGTLCDTVPVTRVPLAVVLNAGRGGSTGDRAHRDRLAGSADGRGSHSDRIGLRGTISAVIAVRIDRRRNSRPRRPVPPVNDGCRGSASHHDNCRLVGQYRHDPYLAYRRHRLCGRLSAGVRYAGATGACAGYCP